MDFNFTEEQRMLRDMVGAFLADRYDFDSRRAALAAPEGWSPQIWRAFAEELGVLGAALPESVGGLGGGPVENHLIMEALGEAIVVEPYLETAVIGGGFLKRAGTERADALAAAIVSGEAVTAFAWTEPQGRWNPADLTTTAKRDGSGWRLDGRKTVVHAGPWASHLIVTARTGGGQRETGGVSVFLVDKAAAGVTTRDYATVDGRRASEVQFDAVALGADAAIGSEGEALPLVEQVLDEAAAAACSEGVGVMRVLHAQTMDYAKQRKQFGRAIADFQVIQHRMVDMFMALEQAVSMTLMATIKLDEPAAERARAVSAAKVQVGQALRFVGQNAIQIHGGIGMTDELAAAHYFKRATVLESLFGSVDHHLARFERLNAARAA